MSLQQYYDNEYKRVLKNYNKSKHLGFKNNCEYAKWFVEHLKVNNCKCYYCETSIHNIIKLIDKGLLKTRKTGYGERGKVLEIDKNDDVYTKELCVLSCYYCNNDKSYITTKEDYKKFFGENRKKYFELLLSKI